jgi:MFS family permease
VLQITAAAWLGLVAAFQFLPMLVLGPMGGVVADRVDKRRFLFATQALGVLAAALGLIVLARVVQLWMVFAFRPRPRHRQRLRHAGSPDLRVRDGGPRPADQRRR